MHLVTSAGLGRWPRVGQPHVNQGGVANNALGLLGLFVGNLTRSSPILANFDTYLLFGLSFDLFFGF